MNLHYKKEIPEEIDIYCNRCNKYVLGDLKTTTYYPTEETRNTNTIDYWKTTKTDIGIYRCPICNKYVCVFFNRNIGSYNEEVIFNRIDSYPKEIKNNFLYLDYDLDNRLNDIYKSYNVNSYNLAIMGTRALLQKIVRQIGKNIIDEKDDDLLKEINKLYKNNLITKDLKDTAHNIRIIGNKYAHPEEIDEMFDKDDADNIISLLENFILLLIEIPNKIKQLKLKKEDKENGIQV